MPSRSFIRWAVIPGVSLGLLTLSAALSFWLTRPALAPPPPVAEDSLPGSHQPTSPEPSPPSASPAPVVPPPAFPSSQRAVPVLPAPGTPDARRVVEAEPVIESLSGALSHQDVRQAIQAVSPLIQQCFEDAAQRSRGPQEVKLRFTVEARNGRGQLGSGEVVASTVVDPFVQACALDSLLDAQFPAPEGVGRATVVYPFLFREPGEAGR